MGALSSASAVHLLTCSILCTGLSILISDIGLIGMGWLLYQFGQTYGWKAFVAYYFVPYVVSGIVLEVRHWLMVLFIVVQPLVCYGVPWYAVLPADTPRLRPSSTFHRIGECKPV